MLAIDVVKQYYDYFNNQNFEGMISLVHPDIKHYPNQGELREGKGKFIDFMKGMDEAYEERLSDIVFYTESAGTKVAAEFTVNGIYKKADDGFPPAHGQKYVLPAAAFLEVKEGKISKVSTHYNLPLWIKLVS
jgi:steroid delta-isomerase-like uncharacterized protein